MPFSRAATRRGGDVGSEAGISQVSLVSWSPQVMLIQAREADVPTPMKKPGSCSS